MNKIITIIFGILLIATNTEAYSSFNKKDIITYSDNSTFFKVKGYGSPSPSFIGGMNFYCFLKLPNYFFSSGQIDSVLIFKLSNGDFGFIYRNADSETIFIKTGKKHKQKLSSKKQFWQLPYKYQKVFALEMFCLDKKLVFKDISCVYFRWHSGGIYFREFENLKDGIGMLLGHSSEKKAKPISGIIHFTDWENNLKKWPEIESIEWK